MSGAIGIEQVGQLVRCALLIADWVVPGVWSVCEMCGVEKVVVTIDLGFAVDRHDASFQYHTPPNKRLAVSSGEWESCSSPTTRFRLSRMGPGDRALGGVKAPKLLPITPYAWRSSLAGRAAQHDRRIAPAAPT